LNTAIGKNVRRKEAWEKVTGQTIYTGDLPSTGVLAARLLTSTHAHARILQMDISQAWKVQGVLSVITGSDFSLLFGIMLQDRPALASHKVRYAGEPVAMVIAKDEHAAELAVRRIRVEYEPLPVLLRPSESIKHVAPLIHDKVHAYKKIKTDVYPEAGTNIASRYRMRKGDAAVALAQSEVKIQQQFYLPPSDHLAMEVRTARAEITAEGTVVITTASQSPYAVRTQLSEAFNIPAGQIRVKVPFVGGGFGGKAAVMLEILAYMATKSVSGQPVRLIIPREQDMASAPCRIGMEATICLGASRDGYITAAELTYLVDCGAYTAISPNMAKACAVDCTGPYNIENLSCDSLCVYTNHTFATSYRSFAHESYTFCIERALDMLACKCGIDPFELRSKNAIRPGHTTPSKVVCTPGNVGNLSVCLEKLKNLSGWEGGKVVNIKPDTVRAKGVACLWKTENPPTDAISGALITFNPDGSLNLNTGVVENGEGGQTHLAQMLAEKLKIDTGQIHVEMPVDTRLAPEHWKTVASLTEYMAGHAVVRAADDIIQQLRKNGAQAFGCEQSEIEVAHGRVYMRQKPDTYISFKDIVNGYKAPDGASVGEPVLGRGGFMLKGLTMLDPQTGEGRPGPAWTVGAQVVEVEVDTKTFTYRILSASTVIDVGNTINPEAMRAMVAGGMAMGMSMASRESFSYDRHGVPLNPNLRTYKLMHIGQEPIYRVDFVQTPEDDSPYGVRGYSEHGIIGIPAALANALSLAIGKQITELPLLPEKLWRLSGGADDTV
jgi:CO/xanthine dehydrogenase Mo-binding subunit